jgi:hypothetical protein
LKGLARMRCDLANDGAGSNQSEPLLVPGVHLYTDQQSVTAGQKIRFHVSSSVPYVLSVVRLGLQVDDPAGDEVIHEFPKRDGAIQPIFPGSHVHIEKGIRGPLAAFSLECWVRPWKLKQRGGLITQGEEGLFISQNYDVLLRGQTAGRLEAQKWRHVVATSEGLWLDSQKIAVHKKVHIRDFLHTDSLRFGHGLDGDLAMIVIYNYALSPEAIATRFKQKGLEPARGRGVLGCWPFAEEKGDRVADVSGHRRHGRIINSGTWMIGGPSFDATVPRFGNYDPAKDARRGHGLRLATDDLYDCGWKATQEFRLPADARSGIYVGRARFELDGKPHLQHVTFIVRTPARRRAAAILLLTATNTWRAYNAAAFSRNKPRLKAVAGTDGMANSPGDPPAFSYYRGHAAGQGTYQVGLRMPWPASGPYVLYGGRTDYSHLMRAERFAQVWLEKAGYDYDVICDVDLHRNPAQLRDYKVFMINGHSEYWSIPMYNGLKDYLHDGGNLICLSGNSLFWRVSFNDQCTIMECRKVDAPGEELPASRRGECWHSHDGKRGGPLRECNYPAWKLIGLEMLGWNNHSNPENFGPYIAERADHFLFHGSGVKNGDELGGRFANGHEFDVRLSTLAALQGKPSPEGACEPRDPPGIIRLANGVIPWNKGGAAFDYFFRGIKPKTDQGAEMIYWERPDGGCVFNAGSIGSGWALLADAKFQKLVSNVLAHFGVAPYPAAGGV